MVGQVDDFDTIFVRSASSRPWCWKTPSSSSTCPEYNILLKDGKGYPFVRLSTEPYPRFSMVNQQGE